jgi:heme exporter protein C
MQRTLLAVWLSAVIVLAFSLPMAARPSSWYELPIIPGLEDKARILFFHVPTEWLATVGFIASMIYGIRYLKRRDPEDDVKSATAAGIGFLFCILATVTGAIWAKFSWGTYWNWDPRQTSIFVLLLIYGAYFALRSAVEIEEKRAALSAVYAIIAAIVMPFFMFVMPRILASLHPQPVLNVEGKTQMNGTMLLLLLASFAGFTALSVWVWNLQVRIQRIAMSIPNSPEGGSQSV